MTPKPMTPTPAPPHIVLANDRRLRLIEQKYRRGPSGGLTAEEQSELNECARVMGEWVTRMATVNKETHRG